jgi:hypothetical protein
MTWGWNAARCESASFRRSHATWLERSLTGKPAVGKRGRLPTARDEELGCPLGRGGLSAQEIQQFCVDLSCMCPRDAVRTALDDHEARA